MAKSMEAIFMVYLIHFIREFTILKLGFALYYLAKSLFSIFLAIICFSLKFNDYVFWSINRFFICGCIYLDVYEIVCLFSYQFFFYLTGFSTFFFSYFLISFFYVIYYVWICFFFCVCLIMINF